MVGGKVFRIRRFPNSVVVFVEDRPYEMAGIRLAPNNYAIERGDSLWWQHQHAYWTPANGELKDVKIPRIGYAWDPTFVGDIEPNAAGSAVLPCDSGS